MKNIIRILVFVVATCLFTLQAVSCGGVTNSSSGSSGGDIFDGREYVGIIAPDKFLRAEGDRLVDEKGNAVTLRGVNAGGLGVIEKWMTGFAPNSSDGRLTDHYLITKEYISRFGMDGAKELWEEYRKNWWNETDFKNCADMGMNVVRLPFTYMNVDFNAIVDFEYGGTNYDFTFLENFVDSAAKYGLYTILDMHGSYGSQNGKDHSGQVKRESDIDFYSNPLMRELTIDLWKAIARRFKGNQAVAGYDILNEPAETINNTQTTTKRHWDFFDEVYRGIREVDPDHVIIFESCWEGRNMPSPDTYGWTNCVYSFHHYTGETGNAEAHCANFTERIKEISSRNFGVPVYMGEFTCYNRLDSWNYTLSLLDSLGWSWTTWTYKIWGTSPWGIYQIRLDNNMKVNARDDSFLTIKEKFAILKTSFSAQMSMVDGVSVYDIIKTHCHTETAEKVEFESDNYKIKELKTGKFLKAGEILMGTAFYAEFGDIGTAIAIASHSPSFPSLTLSFTINDNTNYLAVNEYSESNEAAFMRNADPGFLPVKGKNGCFLLSLGTYKFLRYDSAANRIYADASSTADACAFSFDKV